MNANSAEPLIVVELFPSTEAQRQAVCEALRGLTMPDGSARLLWEKPSIVLGGHDEMDLQSVLDATARKLPGPLRIQGPHVRFRETISHLVEHRHEMKKIVAQRGLYADVTLLIRPTDPAEPVSFRSRVADQRVPDAYVPGVEAGVRSVFRAGPVAGYPMAGVAVELLDGRFMDTDSSVQSFELAARQCLREGLIRAGAAVEEPVMAVEVFVPTIYAEGVLKDLIGRRARELHRERSQGGGARVLGSVPLANMFGYQTALRALTKDRADWAMAFQRWEKAEGRPDLKPL